MKSSKGTDFKSVPQLQPAPHRILVTCEHGGNEVPAAYRTLFRGRRGLLDSHRGFDIGALEAARFLRRRLRAPLICSIVTRLLVDLNRSVGHPRLFSEFSRGLDAEARGRVVERYYRPYRRRVQDWIGAAIGEGGSVLHLSVHSFTPVLNRQPRRADVGLLYDPRRSGELAFCREWRKRLRVAAPALRVRRNYPYRGTSDGLIPALRRQFPAARYIGIEVEINQRSATRSGVAWHGILAALVASLPAGHR